MEADKGVSVVRFQDQEQYSGDRYQHVAQQASDVATHLATARACLRRRLGGTGAPGWAAGWVVPGALTCCPHFGQKRAPAGTSFPQLLQNAIAPSSHPTVPTGLAAGAKRSTEDMQTGIETANAVRSGACSARAAASRKGWSGDRRYRQRSCRLVLASTRRTFVPARIVLRTIAFSVPKPIC